MTNQEFMNKKAELELKIRNIERELDCLYESTCDDWKLSRAHNLLGDLSDQYSDLIHIYNKKEKNFE